MKEDMMDLYKQLSLANQRNELSDLLMKIDGLLDALISKNNLSQLEKVKNYDVKLGENLTEKDMLAFLFEDVGVIKNKILMLLTLDSINN